MCNLNKKLFWENFSKEICKPRLSSTKICESSPQFLQFHLGSILHWKIPKVLTQVLSYVFCIQLRRQVHKQITKRRYREEKSRRFAFRKPVLFTLGLGRTTSYSLGLLVWNFYQTFVTVCIEFWQRFEPQIHPTRFAINVLFITTRVERKVHLCVKLFDFFPRWILIRLTWNLSRFVPNSIKILTSNFGKKLFRKNFSKYLCKPRLPSTKIY